MYLMTFLPEEGGHLPSWVAAPLPSGLASPCQEAEPTDPTLRRHCTRS